MTVQHGWYSKKMADCVRLAGELDWRHVRKPAGRLVYATAEGKEVVVTLVTSEKKHETAWDDMAYVGEVVRFVREAP